MLDPDLIGEDIGEGSFIRREYRLLDGALITYPVDAEIPEGAVFVGIQENHRNAEGAWCGGWVGFSNVEGGIERAKHELVQADPLTISPSLLCPRCGHHGHIREGRWENC